MWLLAILVVIASLVAYKLIPAIARILKFQQFQKNQQKPVPCYGMYLGLGPVHKFTNTKKTFNSMLGISSTFFETGGVYSMPIFFNNGIYVVNPEDVKCVLYAKASKFPKTEFGFELIDFLIGQGLITSMGEKWKRKRLLIQPLFSPKAVSGMMNKMYAQTEAAIETWKSKYQAGSGSSSSSASLVLKEFSEEASRITLNIIASCAFGVEDKQTLEVMTKAWSDVIEALLPVMFGMMMFGSWWIKVPLPANRKMSNATNTIRSIASNLIVEKQKQLKEQKIKAQAQQQQGGGAAEEELNFDNTDLLSLLVTATDENGERLSEKETIDECTTFLFAGHETTSSWFSWIMYNVAIYPEVQAALHKEIDDFLEMYPNTNPNYEQLHQLRQIHNVIQETLRLYPPAMKVTKKATQDIQLPSGYVVPKDCEVTVDFISLHRNPTIWKNADTFDPDRWNPERLAADMKHETVYCFTPFSAGSRNCVGKLFAATEAPIMLFTVLKHFSVKLAEGTKPTDVVKDLQAGLKATGLNLEFTPRKK